MLTLRPKLIGLLLLIGGLASARPLSPQDQVSIHDYLITQENGAYAYAYFTASTATEVQFWLGRAVGLSEAASLAYNYDSTESFSSRLSWCGEILAAMAQGETDIYYKAYLNGLASGFNQANAYVGGF